MCINSPNFIPTRSSVTSIWSELANWVIIMVTSDCIALLLKYHPAQFTRSPRRELNVPEKNKKKFIQETKRVFAVIHSQCLMRGWNFTSITFDEKATVISFYRFLSVARGAEKIENLLPSLLLSLVWFESSFETASKSCSFDERKLLRFFSTSLFYFMCFPAFTNH